MSKTMKAENLIQKETQMYAITPFRFAEPGSGLHIQTSIKYTVLHNSVSYITNQNTIRVKNLKLIEYFDIHFCI